MNVSSPPKRIEQQNQILKMNRTVTLTAEVKNL